MKRLTSLVVALLAVATLTACAGTSSSDNTPVIAPLTMSADELQGATVELVLGQVLNITTGDLDVESYTGKVTDPKVAEFVPGRKDATAEFNPGVDALAVGHTEVVLSNTDGGIQDVTFTLHVTDR